MIAVSSEFLFSAYNLLMKPFFTNFALTIQGLSLPSFKYNIPTNLWKD